MIIADFLNISINLIFVAQIVVCVLLLGIILMQRPKQEGLGAAFGAAITDQAFGARTTDVLQKGTVYLGSLFMILSFALSLLIVHRSDKEKSALSTIPVEQIELAKEKKAAEAEKARISNTELLKELTEGQEQTAPQPVTPAPAAPVAPTTPAAPSTPAPAPAQ